MVFLWGSSGGDNTTNNGDWLGTVAIIVSCLLAVAFVVAVIFLVKVKRKEVAENKIDNIDDYYMAFGGKENIVSCEAKSSRLVVVLNDYELMDETKLKTLGIEALVKASDKVTLIVGEKAEVIAKELSK